MKIACLMGTYGRYTLACDALTCFLQQTALQHATLLIYNQHPTPLAFDHPRVRVVNEVTPNQGLRAIRNRMIELADPDAELMHWWPDDDLILPWHLEDCLRHIGDHVAWKPARSWTFRYDGTYTLEGNVFEGTAVYRISAMREVPRDAHPNYPDHPANWALYREGRVAKTELGDLSSFLYRWASGVPHLSLYAKSKNGHVADFDHLRSRLTDTGDGEPLKLANPWPNWDSFLRGIAPLVTPESLDEIQARLAVAAATVGFG
jgi:glycosyltransferase involved in cell wall biosynthesis